MDILLSGVYVLNVLAAVIIVFRERREIAATWGWLLVLTLLPGIGLFIYIFFGKKISQIHIFDLRVQEKLGATQVAKLQQEQLVANRLLFDQQDNPYVKELAMLFLESEKSPVTTGNDVTFFTDGQEKFAQLLDDIQQAQHHIHMLYYIFHDDTLGSQLMEALIDKAKQGVEVRLIYDAWGSSSTSYRFWKKLEEAGGKAIPFFGQSIGFVNWRINYRNHRKIVVIDGMIGYVGGFNVGDEYLGKGPLGKWRDSHIQIKGNAVLTLQARFVMDWNAVVKKEDELDYDSSYFNVQEDVGEATLQIVSSGPDSELQQIKMGMMKMISMAKKTILIQAPYFIPDESMSEVLKIAVLSGVDVRIMIPCKPDHAFVYRATEYYAREMAEIGAKVYIYEDGFLHAKTMIVDGEVATIGTANFDVRSFKLNFEVNAFVYDKQVIQKMEKAFAKDMLMCTNATREYFEMQSGWKKIKQLFSRLFSPIL